MHPQTESHSTNCPLAAIDRRLEDVHRQWHEAESAYFDPEGFRVAIQAVIQTLRTVTFILQSNKQLIPNFDSWYGGWRKKLAAEPLMRWMVDARNKIEKQGDLETHSFIRAEIVSSYLNEGPVVQVPAKLFDSIANLLKEIPSSQVGEHMRESGTLRIQRRWIENTLPDFELLDAVAIAYGRIAELVHDAHHALGLPTPLTINTNTKESFPVGRGGRMPCMIGHADARTMNFSLSDGSPVEFTTDCIEFDADKVRRNAERHGIAAGSITGKGGDPERLLESIFSAARKVTEIDGYHDSILFIVKSGIPVKLLQLEFGARREKYLMMRNLAHEATRLEADAVILIGETWLAPLDVTRPYMAAVDSVERLEYLSATLVRKEGEPVELAAKFIREDKIVTLGETERMVGGTHYMFAPFYEAWGRPIPEAWLGKSSKFSSIIRHHMAHLRRSTW